MNKEKLKHDILFLFIVFFIACFIWLIYHISNNGNANTVIVSQDGNIVGEYPISEEKLTAITYEEDHYNLLQIHDGSVSVLEADCPDQICAGHKPISQGGESIICLPHKLVIQISAKENTSDKGGGIDALTY